MKTLTVPAGRFTAVCYTADGKYLLALQSGWRLHIWATADLSPRFIGKLPGTLHRHHALTLAGNLAVGTRGVYDFTDLWATLAQKDGLVRRKDLIREVILREKENQFTYVDYGTNGQVIVRMQNKHSTAHFKTTVWDTAGHLLRTLTLPRAGSPPPVVSPDGGTLVVLARLGARLDGARLHDSTTGAEVRQLAHTDMVNLAAFSPDGRWLATGAGRSLWLWEVSSGTGHRFPAFQKYVTALAFHPDSTLLAAADGTGEIRVLNTSGGGAQASLNFEVGGINGLAFSPDRMTVAGAGHRRAVVVWDLE
jgi:WD40 repeat protein